MTEISDPGYSFDKDVSVDVCVDVNLSFDTWVDYDSYTNVYVDVCVDPYVEGNTAKFAIDVEAVGDDSYAELNLAVLTTDGLSMITASGIAITD